MIVSEKYKSYSLFTNQEQEESLLKEIDNMSEDELEIFMSALIDPELERTFTAHEQDREIVPVEQWLEDEYYMGEIGKTIYQPWKDDLIELFESDVYDMGVIVGGIGSGKSTFSHLATLRMLYEASCLADPARSYGLAPNSIIGFCNLATSKETARRVVFEGIGAKLKESPYFKYEFPPIKDVKDEILFDKGLAIIAGSSTDTSIIGMNIFGGIFDEGNFMRGYSKKVMKEMQGRGGKGTTKAGRLFEAVRRRMKSRYMKKGRLPGVLMVISSKTTQDSFTEQLVRKHIGQNSTTTFVRDRNIIEVKRQDFEDKMFKVVVGDESYRSKILTEGESESDFPGATILEIPEDLRTDFEDNMEDALRDIAGVSTMAIFPFISKPDKVDAMKDPDREHPFRCPIMSDPLQWDSHLPYRINWNKLSTRHDNGEWEPKLNPQAKRHVHFDPALTGDSFGLCIAHIAGTVSVLKDPLHDIYEDLPYFVVDFVLSIQGEPGEEVIFKNVRQLTYEFSSHGFHLAEFSMDGYQSREMIQTLREQGYKAGLYSVDLGQSSKDEDPKNNDRTMEGNSLNRRKQAYRYLRSVIYDERISCYDYPILFREIKMLEETPVMIDHPEIGSKDIADALAGCVWTLFRANYAVMPLPPQKGISLRDRESMTMDENFVSRQVNSGALVAKPRSNEEEEEEETEEVTKGPRKYFKKQKPKSVPPRYKKVSHDGSEEDLTATGEDSFLARG